MISDSFRTNGLYTVGETARLAGVHPRTARGWLQGYATAGGVRTQPVFGRDPKGMPWVSFLELAELVIVAKFRRAKVPLRTLRQAHRFAGERFGTEYPFAHLKMARFGRQVLHEFRERHPTKAHLLVLDRAGQYILPGLVADEYLHFDFAKIDQLAIRWFPHGKSVPIVLDPRFGSGRPTVEGRGLRIETLLKRNEAGQNVASLAEDFMLDIQTVRKVLEHAA